MYTYNLCCLCVTILYHRHSTPRSTLRTPIYGLIVLRTVRVCTCMWVHMCVCVCVWARARCIRILNNIIVYILSYFKNFIIYAYVYICVCMYNMLYLFKIIIYVNIINIMCIHVYAYICVFVAHAV